MSAGVEEERKGPGRRVAKKGLTGEAADGDEEVLGRIWESGIGICFSTGDFVRRRGFLRVVINIFLRTDLEEVSSRVHSHVQLGRMI